MKLLAWKMFLIEHQL